jgi:hypothetical protein
MKKLRVELLGRLRSLALFQVCLLSAFLGFVYADRVTVEMVFKPLEAVEKIWIFHHVFFQVLATVIFGCIALAYWLGGGSWKFSLAGFIESMILTHSGVEDYLYYALFGERVPKFLTWLSWNGYLIKTSQLTTLFPVTSQGLELGVALSILFVGAMWTILIRQTRPTASRHIKSETYQIKRA